MEKTIETFNYCVGLLQVTHTITHRKGTDKNGDPLKPIDHFTTIASEEAQQAAREAYKDGNGTFEAVCEALNLTYCASKTDGNPNGTPCVNLGDSNRQYWRNFHDILNACNIQVIKRTETTTETETTETTTRNNKRRGKEKQTITNISRLEWLVDLFNENVQRYFGCSIDLKERLSDVYHVAKERDLIEAFRNYDKEQERKQAQTSAEELKKLQQVALMFNRSVDEVAAFKFGLSPDEAIKYVDELELKAAPALQ